MNGTSYRSYFVSGSLNSRVLRPSHAAFTVNHLFLYGLALQGIHLHLSVSGKFPECTSANVLKRTERTVTHMDKQWSYWITPDVYGLHCQSILKQQYIDFKQSLLNKRRSPFRRCTYQLSPRNHIQFSSVLLPAMDPSPEGRNYTQICSSISGELPPLPSTGDGIA